MGPEPQLVHVEFVMGTAITFDVRLDSGSDREREDAATALGEAIAWLHWADKTFTTYDATSCVCRLRRGEITLDACPSEVATVVAMCHEWRERTDGWFDPWAGPEGFDPSGLVKGWSTEQASHVLRRHGFRRHCINAGGDVVAAGAPGGSPTWGIGVVDPFDRHRLRLAARVVDKAVATSGTAERGLHVWQRDGSPATQLASVTIIDDELTRADVLATAALAMGDEALTWLTSRQCDAYAVDTSGAEWMTGGFADQCERLT